MLRQGTQLEVYLTCQDGNCATLHEPGILADVSFESADSVQADFTLQAFSGCADAGSCGYLTVGTDVPVSPNSVTCLGTVRTRAARYIYTPFGLFYVRAGTAPSTPFEVTDSRCIPGLVAAAAGTTTALIPLPSPPSSPPEPPPPAAAPSNDRLDTRAGWPART